MSAKSVTRSTAIVLANRRFMTPNGKTAHGLVRGSERFDVRVVVDPDGAGRDAGEALDGQHRAIPVVATLDEALAALNPAPSPPITCVVGVATHGGRLEPEIRALLLDAPSAASTLPTVCTMRSARIRR